MMPNINQPEMDKNNINWKDLITYSIAVLSLAGFSWFIYYLVGRTNSASELEWTRSVYLLSGVEAIVFAAAGFLFGREVHRVRAEKAEEKAGLAETIATEAQSRAVAAETKGESLASAIFAKQAGMESKASEYEAFAPQAEAALTKADLKELAEMAQSMFPQKGK